MMKLISKYSEAITPFIFSVLLFLTVFWGQGVLGEKADVAILAALTTLFGVSLNHLVQVVGQRKREKDKREFEVRRDIYLEFAEGVARNLSRLSKLLRFDLQENQTQGSANNFIGAVNKVRLVGSTITIEGLENLVKSFTKFELSMRQERNGVNARITEIKQIDEQFKKNQEMMTQISTYLQNMKPGWLGWTANDTTQIETLKNQWANLNNQNTALVARRQQVAQDAIQVEKDFRIHYVRGIATIRPILTDILISIREELGVAVDAGWYRYLAQSVDEELREEFERIIQGAQTQPAKKDIAPVG